MALVPQPHNLDLIRAPCLLHTIVVGLDWSTSAQPTWVALCVRERESEGEREREIWMGLHSQRWQGLTKEAIGCVAHLLTTDQMWVPPYEFMRIGSWGIETFYTTRFEIVINEMEGEDQEGHAKRYHPQMPKNNRLVALVGSMWSWAF